MKTKKLKRKLARRVLAGKITVDEARARLGRGVVQKSGVPALVKAQGISGVDAVLAGIAAQRVPRRPVTQADLISAINAPMIILPAARPARSAKSAAAPKHREAPQVLKSAQSPAPAGAPPRWAQQWTGTQAALWRQHQDHADPAAREAAYADLIRQGMIPTVEPVRRKPQEPRALGWGTGPDGQPGWQQPQQPQQAQQPGLRIAPPGTAGR